MMAKFGISSRFHSYRYHTIMLLLECGLVQTFQAYSALSWLCTWLSGIIPGPHEPALHMNSFLQPLVEELKKLWSGVIVHIEGRPSVFIRAAPICVACDIPAARKVCGFLAHSALRGVPSVWKCFQQRPLMISLTTLVLTMRTGMQNHTGSMRTNTRKLRHKQLKGS